MRTRHNAIIPWYRDCKLHPRVPTRKAIAEFLCPPAISSCKLLNSKTYVCVTENLTTNIISNIREKLHDTLRHRYFCCYEIATCCWI